MILRLDVHARVVFRNIKVTAVLVLDGAMSDRARSAHLVGSIVELQIKQGLHLVVGGARYVLDLRHFRDRQRLLCFTLQFPRSSLLQVPHAYISSTNVSVIDPDLVVGHVGVSLALHTFVQALLCHVLHLEKATPGFSYFLG